MVGFVAFAVAHWLCDLGWNEVLSLVTHRGGTLLGHRFYRFILAASGVFLAYLGVLFVVDGLRGLV